MRLWVLAILRIAVVIGVLAALGYALGYPVSTVLVGLALYAGWHVRQLLRLTQWLQSGDLDNVPDPPGAWGELAAQLRGLVFKDLKRERRFAIMLREYQEATAAMPDASVMLNDNREILWINIAASRLLGLDSERDVGQRVDNLIRRPEFAAFLTGKGESRALEIPSPVDKKIKLQVHTVPFGAGRRLLMFRDNTRLRQLEKVRRKFVANASHELRSPLTVVSGYLEQISDAGVLGSEWDLPLGEMQRQARRMAAIIDDLLELSRLESADQFAAREPVDVPVLLRDVVNEAASQVEVPPAIDLNLRSPRQLLGEDRELHSIFANLVINAVKYTPAGGHIEVAWDADDSGGRITVRDTGIGIAPEHLARLTERFYRVDKGRARQAGGTGLGLAIVKYALQRHEATLEIESELGAGSVFTCAFPPDRVSAGADAPSRPAGALGTTG